MEWSAAELTDPSTKVLKDQAGRDRPLHENNDSFPSDHTSHAAVGYTLAYRNLESATLSDSAKTAGRLGADGLTLATGWSRLEGGSHYPSDIQVGLALGHFLATFHSDAFLGLDKDVFVDVAPIDPGVEAAIEFHY